MPVPTTFRTDFPEFADASVYKDEALQFWDSIAEGLISSTLWGTMFVLGVELFIAHNLVLDKRNRDVAATGGTPGAPLGALTAKEVDTVAARYDPKYGMYAAAGTFNLTTYGTRFYQMARMFGAGGIQL